MGESQRETNYSQRRPPVTIGVAHIVIISSLIATADESRSACARPAFSGGAKLGQIRDHLMAVRFREPERTLTMTPPPSFASTGADGGAVFEQVNIGTFARGSHDIAGVPDVQTHPVYAGYKGN
jgi:hypothetical protein